MSAPGNSILIIALIALFVACCGYAAGRIHQRRQTGEDRKAAYQDGYEKGSHSVFSLAARVIVPRRPVRAAAPVKPESEARDETTLLPQLSGSSAPAPVTALRSSLPLAAQSSSPATGRPSPPNPRPLDQAASRSAAQAYAQAASELPSRTERPSPRSFPHMSSQASTQPAPSASAQPASAQPAPAQQAPAQQAPSMSAQSTPEPAPRPSAQPAPQLSPPPPQQPPMPMPSQPPAARPVSGAGVSQMGFPVPPPPPNGTVPEPPAVGGVRFQRFPDPRTGKETTVLPDMSKRPEEPSGGDSVPAPRRAPGHRAVDDEEDTIVSPAEPTTATTASSSGRHTVPDELVKAATYRLPPDRVFRAKVRDTTDEPTTKLVPKPRQS